MRIKCPNSDILLELPGDRTDMKFTCPACHKVHRVTVNISTPGEEPPPQPGAGSRSVTRSQATVPKKYATGAYAPVVDIPIDANFILLDRDEAQSHGIDLGAATDPNPPRRDSELFSRETEQIRRPADQPRRDAAPPPRPRPAAPPPASPPPRSAPPPEPPSPAADSDETAKEDDAPSPAPADTRPEGRRIWDEVTDSPAAAAAASENEDGPDAEDDGQPGYAGGEDSAEADDEDEEDEPQAYSSAGRRAAPERKGHAGLWLFLLAVLAGAGFVGWQEYKLSSVRADAASLLAWADSALEKGEIQSAAQAARDARSKLLEGRELHSLTSLYNRLAEWSGLFAPRPDANQADDERIDAHIRRESGLEDFTSGLDPADPAGVAQNLRAAVAEAGADEPLVAAMRSSALDAVIRELEESSAAASPEEAIAGAEAARAAIMPEVGQDLAAGFGARLDGFAAGQRERLKGVLRDEIAGLARAAAEGEADAIRSYLAVRKRLAAAALPGLTGPIPDLAGEADQQALRQLDRLSGIVEDAEASARSVLSRPEDEDNRELDDLARQAEADDRPSAALARAAAGLVDGARAQADELLSLRTEVFTRLQSELRRNRNYPGTRLAWSMLRIAFDDREVLVDPSAFRFDSNSARMEFSFHGLPAVVELTGDNYEKSFVATVDGFSFSHGWPFLMHKPLLWMAGLARDMRRAGVDPARRPNWELLEGPAGPVALSRPGAAGAAFGSVATGPERVIFYDGELLPVADLPVSADAGGAAEQFRRVAVALRDSVMEEEEIPTTLRQALEPVLLGTYQSPDPRDYFDSAFCRRLIEANYLETNLAPMPETVRSALEEYRAALGRLEAGYDDFKVNLPDGSSLYAVARLAAGGPGGDAAGNAGDQDPDTGESLPRLSWRVERPGETVFHSSMPSRFAYAFMLAEHYPGEHKARPAGEPERTVVRHATRGEVATYDAGADAADGDADLWAAAVAEDSLGRFDPTAGPPGWGFPLHVVVRDDQGDPVRLATTSGVVASPDFTAVADAAERRGAEDAWLDGTARTLAEPGELGLIFYHFFRYCSDSPLPEKPNLIGSHFGLSDTHQTVYQSLERRWVGRLIGDCDDLAEFFQVLTRRQGKLSHVMQLPAHAAAGYVDKLADDEFRFVLLQTGPVLQFTAPTLNEVVETAYRFFDREDGMSHMTTDAVPLLLRFADEETRTPFVLSARIYADSEYAEKMIRVQSYWHQNVYSAAIRTMEEMVAADPEVGSVKELGSLYERVGFYDKSAEMRRRELELVAGQPQAAISTLYDIAQLHFQDKDREKALAALTEMETRMQDMIRGNNVQDFFTALTFRSYWAMYLARLGQPARAWKLVQYDVAMTKRAGRIADPVLQTLVAMYARMSMARDAGGLSDEDAEAMAEVRRELEEAFGRGYFTSADSYNSVLSRYFVLGRFAVADVGRAAGLRRLEADGPYPEGPKDQSRRGRGVGDGDWDWFRITPRLYSVFAQEMLDRDEYPELYDPAGAKPILELVSRSVEKGARLGSEIAGGDDVIAADMTLSFINRDLAAFSRCMRTVKEKNYSSLYDEAAMMFGLQCGLVPPAEFAGWITAFREHFPGRQHYFKVVYRAIDKENYDHALMMAEATARFFPDDAMLRAEADFVRSIIPGLKERQIMRQYRDGGAGAFGMAG